jgi:hypothetical protein
MFAAALAMVFDSNALAVSTMADWTGQNTNPSNNTFTVVTTNNNYGLTSDTSIGGTIQSKINLAPEGLAVIDEHHVYFSDPTLEGPTLDFTSTLHMEGTITFDSPTATEPNICFCWYASEDTRHRIGLGISNFAVTQNIPGGDYNNDRTVNAADYTAWRDGGTLLNEVVTIGSNTPEDYNAWVAQYGDVSGAEANLLRIDFGYAASGGNRFFNVSADGTGTQTPANAGLPSGTYPFTFDYTPGPAGQAGGVMSATVGTFFQTIQPLTTQPWDLDAFTFDRFGIVQRSTASTTNNPTNTYSVEFSNVTYTGGTVYVPPAAGGATAVPEPGSLALAAIAVGLAIGSSVGRLRRR